MIENIAKEDQIFEILEKHNHKKFENKDALSLITQVLLENLHRFSADTNIHNCGKIASLIAAKIYPDRPMSRLIKQWIYEGKYNQFTSRTDVLEDKYSSQRACAVLLMIIEEESNSAALKQSAAEIFRHIKESGALPDDYNE